MYLSLILFSILRFIFQYRRVPRKFQFSIYRTEQRVQSRHLMVCWAVIYHQSVVSSASCILCDCKRKKKRKMFPYCLKAVEEKARKKSSKARQVIFFMLYLFWSHVKKFSRTILKDSRKTSKKYFFSKSFLYFSIISYGMLRLLLQMKLSSGKKSALRPSSIASAIPATSSARIFWSLKPFQNRTRTTLNISLKPRSKMKRQLKLKRLRKLLRLKQMRKIAAHV